jgi:hypothetical protein
MLGGLKNADLMVCPVCGGKSSKPVPCEGCLGVGMVPDWWYPRKASAPEEIEEDTLP